MLASKILSELASSSSAILFNAEFLISVERSATFKDASFAALAIFTKSISSPFIFVFDNRSGPAVAKAE